MWSSGVPAASDRCPGSLSTWAFGCYGGHVWLGVCSISESAKCSASSTLRPSSAVPSLRSVDYAPGETLVSCDDSDQNLYILFSGSLPGFRLRPPRRRARSVNNCTRRELQRNVSSLRCARRFHGCRRYRRSRVLLIARELRGLLRPVARGRTEGHGQHGAPGCPVSVWRPHFI